jgi:hypothetical protein
MTGELRVMSNVALTSPICSNVALTSPICSNVALTSPICSNVALTSPIYSNVAQTSPIYSNVALTSPICQLQFPATPAVDLCPSARTEGLFCDVSKGQKVLVQPKGTYCDSVTLLLIN